MSKLENTSSASPDCDDEAGVGVPESRLSSGDTREQAGNSIMEPESRKRAAVLVRIHIFIFLSREYSTEVGQRSLSVAQHIQHDVDACVEVRPMGSLLPTEFRLTWLRGQAQVVLLQWTRLGSE